MKSRETKEISDENKKAYTFKIHHPEKEITVTVNIVQKRRKKRGKNNSANTYYKNLS